MSTAAATRPELTTALSTAACLVATAALVHAAGAGAVRVLVSGTDIGVQVPLHAGDQAAREQAVAAYAHVLGVEVTYQHSQHRVQAWTQAHGTLGGHQVHVWTITDPCQEA